MTVKELINILKQFPQDTLIRVNDPEEWGSPYDIISVANAEYQNWGEDSPVKFVALTVG